MYSDYYGDMAKSVYARLNAYNKENCGFGVEVVNISEFWSPYWAEAALLYVNMGDTYTHTLCWSPITREWYESDWGSVVEELLPEEIRNKIR